MSDEWREELVSVVTDYRLAWKQPAGRSDAFELLMNTVGGGGGCGGGLNGPYRVKPANPPRLIEFTLTDAEAATKAICDLRAEVTRLRVEAERLRLTQEERDAMVALCGDSSKWANAHAHCVLKYLDRNGLLNESKNAAF